MLKHGYVQFGWRTDVWYEPVCFDIASRRGGDEYEIVPPRDDGIRSQFAF